MTHWSSVLSSCPAIFRLWISVSFWPKKIIFDRKNLAVFWSFCCEVMMIFYIRRNPYGLPILADSELVKTFGRNDFILSVKHYTLIIPLFCKESDHWCYVFVLKYDLLNPQGGGGGEGVLPYIRHISMCRPKGKGFCAFLVWKQV